MPLYTLAVVDKHGHGQPVAHSLLVQENVEHIKLFLSDVMTWNPSIQQATFVTDKDLAEINAIKCVCPNANILLCRFHIMKAFTEELNKHPVSDGDTLLQVQGY